uniref:Pyrin domain-containing protein n=1 Tax=Dicentrarchus labrax TaxID=13489 RepID=A0A8C4DZ55_DICLA
LLQNPSLLIKNTLDNLGARELKEFRFTLRNYRASEIARVPIPWSKLESKGTVDIATIVTEHYGCEEALVVTQVILKEINQRELASQLDGQRRHGEHRLSILFQT